MKKIFAILLSVFMLVGMFSMFSSAVTIVDSGTCGKNVTWTLDSEGTLTISGTGEMEDYLIFYDRNDSPFIGNSSIKSIIIKSGVTSIGSGVFSDCSSLTSVNIPDSVTNIGEWAFIGCTSLTSVNIPDGVTSIDEGAFTRCSSLTSVKIGNSVRKIDAFSFCSSLSSISVSPDNKKYHSDSNCLIETATKTLIMGCKNSVIPVDGSVTSIGNNAFHGCSFTSVNIPDGVKSIGEFAFCECISLNSVNIPNSVTSIGECAFEFCNNLKNVYYTGSVKDWKNINIDFGNYYLTNATIHYNHTHTWDSGKVTKQPTTKSEGIKTFTCTVCKATKQESIARLPVAIEMSGAVYAACDTTAANALSALGTGAKILKADGTELKSTEKVGSGMTLVKPDGTKITIIVKGDNNGDGEVSTADARFALRTAVGLENPNGWKKEASEVDGKSGISTADARLILRCAVGLEALKLY